MIDKTKKVPWGKILSVALYLFELMMETRALVHLSEKDILSNKMLTIIYICFAVYVLFRLVAFYFILVKRKIKVVIALVVLSVVVAVSGSHFFRSNQKINTFNYMIRDYGQPAGDNDCFEVYIDAYLRGRDVYIDQESSQESLLSDSNRMITLNAHSFNRVIVDQHFLLDDETAAAIANNPDYLQNRYKKNVGGAISVVTVFAYMGEDYETCQGLVMCTDSQSNLFFIPKTKWEVLK